MFLQGELGLYLWSRHQTSGAWTECSSGVRPSVQGWIWLAAGLGPDAPYCSSSSGCGPTVRWCLSIWPPSAGPAQGTDPHSWHKHKNKPSEDLFLPPRSLENPQKLFSLRTFNCSDGYLTCCTETQSSEEQDRKQENHTVSDVTSPWQRVRMLSVCVCVWRWQCSIRHCFLITVLAVMWTAEFFLETIQLKLSSLDV